MRYAMGKFDRTDKSAFVRWTALIRGAENLPQPQTGMNRMVDHVVAIVDDNAAILQSMELLLELDGYEVSGYASPASFLADRTMQPACLITDQNMSGMTRLQLV